MEARQSLVSSTPFWFPTSFVKSTCWNPVDVFISKSFHQHFNFVDKFVLLKREMQLLLLSLLRYSKMLSPIISVIIWATLLASNRARRKLNRSKFGWTRKWTIKNIDETSQSRISFCSFVDSSTLCVSFFD